jgi:hypothetical protein
LNRAIPTHDTSAGGAVRTGGIKSEYGYLLDATIPTGCGVISVA